MTTLVRKTGFTLIELLVVVGIIAILSAIALPNFLNAQTRAKVAKVSAELRTLQTGIEAYRVDNNRYPRMTWAEAPYFDRTWSELGPWITTPIAYVTTNFIDPFGSTTTNSQRFTYTNYTYHEDGTMQHLLQSGVTTAAFPVMLTIRYQEAFRREAGYYALCSVGPDLITDDPDFRGYWTVYDPTNGVRSFGNLWRTQREPDPKWLNRSDGY